MRSRCVFTTGTIVLGIILAAGCGQKAETEGWTKIQTGNEALDAQNANVEVVEESADDGDWLLILKVTYPEGVSEAMYPPRYWIYRYLHRADEPFFVCIKGGVTMRYADQFLSAVTEACESAKRM